MHFRLTSFFSSTLIASEEADSVQSIDTCGSRRESLQKICFDPQNPIRRLELPSCCSWGKTVVARTRDDAVTSIASFHADSTKLCPLPPTN